MPNLTVAPNPKIRLRVVHEDDACVVVDKPAGLVTQPGKAHSSDTLLNALFATHGLRLQNLGAARDFGLLHRLDRDASGLVAVALTASAYDHLRSSFAERRVAKRYWAITDGRPSKEAGVIDAPIAEVTGRRKLAAIRADGKEAVTAFKVVSSGPRASLIECRPATGRLHQVRVHLASIGCPILADRDYGPPALRRRAPRLALHNFLLAFESPAGASVLATSPLPGDLSAVLPQERLRAPKLPREL